MGDFTRLLVAVRSGDAGAISEAFELTYRELHELAHQRLRRSSRITMLDTTALVHECYLRLVKLGQLEANDRAHFLGLTVEEIATALGVSTRTIRRDWEKARMLLHAALQS